MAGASAPKQPSGLLHFGIEAKPDRNGRGFVAEYYAPGLVPDLVKDRAGNVLTYPDRQSAKLAAAEAMIATLNAPRRYRDVKSNAKNGKYDRLTGPEFAALLQEANITLTLFAEIYGTTMKRAFSWIDGKNDKGEPEFAPHPARVLLELFKTDQRNIDIAEEVTDRATTPR